MTSRQFKDAIYEQIARVGKALASAPRLELLDLLCQGPRTVEVLAQQLGQSIANTSHHLQILRRARLVEAHKDGTFVTYRLAVEQVGTCYVALRQLAETRLLEIEQFTRQLLESRAGLTCVDRETLIERIRRGEVTLLDVRPADEYRAGHLPGALSVPLRQLRDQLDRLPHDREIVAYCRGPYGVMALDAVAVLQDAGFPAARLDEGVLEWKMRGLAVVVGDER
ncbi:MAG: metalloregulator ArsR/SmtB family transcription factor [Candidatus Schekmanbacteria bacterium]|nr:metalloregulator ArsR/SmtB family transcription factor [Candidatus Schekmanbacteria bacterium]